MRRTATGSIVATVVGLLGACTSGGHVRPAPAPGSSAAAPVGIAGPPTTGADGPPATGTGGPSPGIRWSACPAHAGWDCGTLAVPLDYAHPGPTIAVAVNRHRASKAAHRLGSLLVNPGGPGASGIGFAYAAVGNLLDPALTDAFDVVGFDPRGVGASSPVVCTDGPTLDRINHLDPRPTTPAKLAALVAAAKELGAECQANSGRLLPHLSTLDAARDLDQIRAALGDPRLTYLGFSYGTLLGATYASLFPTHIRALALDSAIDPAVDEATMSIDQARGFEGDLDAFLANCTSLGGACPFRRAGAPTLRAAFDALAAHIGAEPLPAGSGRTLGPGEVLLGIAAPLYDRASWPVLASGLAAAQAGNGQPLLAQYDNYAGRRPDGTYDNEEVANIAINCLDLPPPSIARVEALEATAAQAAPYFGPALVWDDLNCLYWPVAPVIHTGPLHAPGAPPILVVGSTGDPATPFEWAQALAGELGSATLVTRHGEGHGAYPASQCVRALVDRYLTTLAVPGPSSANCPS